MPMQPRPRAETVGPVEPRRRFNITPVSATDYPGPRRAASEAVSWAALGGFGAFGAHRRELFTAMWSSCRDELPAGEGGGRRLVAPAGDTCRAPRWPSFGSWRHPPRSGRAVALTPPPR